MTTTAIGYKQPFSRQALKVRSSAESRHHCRADNLRTDQLAVLVGRDQDPSFNPGANFGAGVRSPLIETSAHIPGSEIVVANLFSGQIDLEKLHTKTRAFAPGCKKMKDNTK